MDERMLKEVIYYLNEYLGFLEENNNVKNLKKIKKCEVAWQKMNSNSNI